MQREGKPLPYEGVWVEPSLAVRSKREGSPLPYDRWRGWSGAERLPRLSLAMTMGCVGCVVYFFHNDGIDVNSRLLAINSRNHRFQFTPVGNSLF